ncbi:MAG: hypothetical protein NTV22_05350 [bacterium]|nr:hypothetical protein [bacterium]
MPGCYAVCAYGGNAGRLTFNDSRMGEYANGAANLDLAFNNVTGALPAPWLTGDIGNGIHKGGAASSNGTFAVSGAGADIAGAADAFRYVSQPASGDCSIVAMVVTQQNTDPWAKAGVMIREDLSIDAPNAAVFITPGNGVRFQWRTSAGGATASTGVAGVTTPCRLRLQRSGTSFAAYYSANGSAWTQIGTSQTVVMASTLTLGLAVTAHNNALLSTATLDVELPEPALTGVLTAALLVARPCKHPAL